MNEWYISVKKMATSPARPASPVEETPQENNEWKENVISPDSIRAMTDAVGIIPLHEDATRELVWRAWILKWFC